MSTTPLTSSLSKDNLCRYFLLPLTDVEVKGALLEKVLLDRKDPVIWLVLHAGVILNGRQSLFSGVTGKHYLSVPIDPWFVPEVSKFREGKYQRFSEAAKARIIERCGLVYNLTDSMNQAVTDIRLLGLLGHEELRARLNDELTDFGDDYPLSEEHELLPSPREDWFFDPSQLST